MSLPASDSAKVFINSPLLVLTGVAKMSTARVGYWLAYSWRGSRGIVSRSIVYYTLVTIMDVISVPYLKGSPSHTDGVSEL